MTFSGTFEAADISMLLRRAAIQPTAVAEKERLIQSGQRHYAEMVTLENPPSPRYLALFEAAMRDNGARMARDVEALAGAIRRDVGDTVTLVSFVRAGCPVGVLLSRSLKRKGCDVSHYGISIVRGLGLDMAAMRTILEARDAGSIIFVDGWTGKGAIATELERSLERLPGVPHRLAVIADPGGRASLAASAEDWLIPTGILGAIVSGLVSRTVIDRPDRIAERYHACMVWDHLAPHDRSRETIDRLDRLVIEAGEVAPAVWTEEDAETARALSEKTVAAVMDATGTADVNRVKPGIAEATRAVLRRVPDGVFVRSRADADLAALVHLADEVGALVHEEPSLCGPYKAVTVIRKVTA